MKFNGILEQKSLNSEKARVIVNFEVEAHDPSVLQQVNGSTLQVTFLKKSKEIDFFHFFNQSTESLVPVGLSDENRSKLSNLLLSVSL